MIFAHLFCDDRDHAIEVWREGTILSPTLVAESSPARLYIVRRRMNVGITLKTAACLPVATLLLGVMIRLRPTV